MAFVDVYTEMSKFMQPHAHHIAKMMDPYTGYDSFIATLSLGLICAMRTTRREHTRREHTRREHTRREHTGPVPTGPLRTTLPVQPILGFLDEMIEGFQKWADCEAFDHCDLPWWTIMNPFAETVRHADLTADMIQRVPAFCQHVRDLVRSMESENECEEEGLREADGPGGLREADGREGRKGYAKLKYKYWCIQKAVFDLFNRGVTKGRFHQHYNNYLTFMIVSFALANFGHALEAFVEQLIHVHATGPNVFDNPHARVEMMRD